MSLTKIAGNPVASKYQLENIAALLNGVEKLNCTVEELIQIFLEEGEKEGIRGDIAFAQACLETGYFRYGGIVEWWQNNYCGLGALDGNETGMCATFESPRIGVRAQIQHLKAYANKEPLNQECVDPRFKYVTRGCAENVEWLGIQENPNGKGWATGLNYGEKILTILSHALNIIDPTKPNEDDPDYEIDLLSETIIFDGHTRKVRGFEVDDEIFININDLKERLDISKDSDVIHIRTKPLEIL